MGGIRKSCGREHPADEAGSSDARLVEGLRRGAPAAFAGLHEQYAAGIYNLALRVVRHAPDAEDITQDVLIRAFERLPRDREVLLRPWLYRLTLNRCYDYLRGSARRPLPVAPGRDLPSPDDPFERSELQRLLEEALGDLTRRQRSALLLKDVHGLTLVEVGACLELTPGSVEVLLARARRAFRAAFEDRCRAVGRPLPGAAGGLAVLPLLPLPPALLAPPAAFVPPVALAPPVSVPPIAAAWPPLTAAAGSGLAAALGLPAPLKTAVLIAVAAATMGTAEVAVHQSDQRPPRAVAAAAAAVMQSEGRVARTTTRSSPAPQLIGAPSHAVTPEPAVAAPVLPSPSPTDVAGPTPAASPLAITTPTALPEPTAPAEPSATPSPTDTPAPQATPSPEPPAAPSPGASPAATATPAPGTSPAP